MQFMGKKQIYPSRPSNPIKFFDQSIIEGSIYAK